MEKEDYGIFFEHAAWASENQSWFSDLLKGYDPFFCDRESAQCLHGQPHIGNIIFTDQHNNIMLVDTETYAHVYGPLSFDLAYFVERFIYCGRFNAESVNSNLEIVRAEYADVFPEIGAMMQQISWYSVVAAIDYRLNGGMQVPESQLQQFVTLEMNARTYRRLVSDW